MVIVAAELDEAVGTGAADDIKGKYEAMLALLSENSLTSMVPRARRAYQAYRDADLWLRGKVAAEARAEEEAAWLAKQGDSPSFCAAAQRALTAGFSFEVPPGHAGSCRGMATFHPSNPTWGHPSASIFAHAEPRVEGPEPREP